MIPILKSYALYKKLYSYVEHFEGVTDSDLFVAKVKPAVFLSYKRKGYYELKKQGYPFLQLSPHARLYAHTEQALTEISDIVKRAKEKGLRFPHEEIGNFLGFPAVAVQDFVKGIPMNKRIFVDYHGIPFVVHEDNVVEAIKDIESRMPIPSYFNTRVYAYKRFYNHAEPFLLKQVDRAESS